MRCIGKRCDDGPPLDGHPGSRLTQRGLLCQRCATRLERTLAEIPARVDLLTVALQPRQGGGDGRGRRSWPVPLDVDAHDHLRLLSATVGSWTQMVVEERSARGPDHFDDPKAASRWLLGQIDWLVHQPWVDDLDDELHDLTVKADGITRWWPRRHRLDAPCPHCSAHQLGRRDGESRVQCDSCGSAWDEAHYQLLCAALAADMSESLTTRQVADLAGVPVSRVRQWASRGFLRRLGTLHGEARYKTAAVEDFLATRGGEDVS